MILALALPLATFATTTPKTPKGLKAGANFCTNLVTKLEKQNQKLSEQLAKYEVKKSEQLKKITENRLNVDERRLGVRSQVDTNRDNRFVKLEARASTTEQKAAVATFKSTLASITEARRQAVDTAVKTYRSSVDQSLVSRKTAVEAARATLKTSIDGLLAKAKADCAANVDAQTVRTTTNEGIKAARELFSTTVKGLDKVKDTASVSSEARKTAIAKAQADFKTAYDKAIVDLKAAFKI